MYTYRHTLSVHDALPIWLRAAALRAEGQDRRPRPRHLQIRRAGAARRNPPPHRAGGETRAHRSALPRSEEHTSELQSLMRLSYAVFCLKTHIDLHSPLLHPPSSFTLTRPITPFIL